MRASSKRWQPLAFNNRTYVWGSAILFIYTFHVLVTLTNRNHVVLLLMSLSLIGYMTYSYYLNISSKTKDIDHFVDNMIIKTQEYDQQIGNMTSQYSNAKKLIRSDPFLLKHLRAFSRLGKHEQHTYNRIISLIVTFYAKYALVLRHTNDAVNDMNDLLFIQKQVLNAIQQLGLQLDADQKIYQTIARLSIVVLSSLSKCFTVIKRKYNTYNVFPTAYELNENANELY